MRPARRFNTSGVTVFMLRYRLPAEGWADSKDVPLQDAQRTMRIIRAGAQGYGVDPARLGVLGFSAGGHVAASLATRPYDPVYKPVDDIDTVDSKPVFAGLMYPVITMSAQGTHCAADGERHGDVPRAAPCKGPCRDTRVSGRRPRLRHQACEGQARLRIAEVVPVLGLQQWLDP